MRLGEDLGLQHCLLTCKLPLEVLLIYPPRTDETHPRTATCLSERDAEQDQLLQALDLVRYQPEEVC